MQIAGPYKMKILLYRLWFFVYELFKKKLKSKNSKYTCNIVQNNHNGLFCRQSHSWEIIRQRDFYPHAFSLSWQKKSNKTGVIKYLLFFTLDSKLQLTLISRFAFADLHLTWNISGRKIDAPWGLPAGRQLCLGLVQC